MMGSKPQHTAWEAVVLPLNYTYEASSRSQKAGPWRKSRPNPADPAGAHSSVGIWRFRLGAGSVGVGIIARQASRAASRIAAVVRQDVSSTAPLSRACA